MVTLNPFKIIANARRPQVTTITPSPEQSTPVIVQQPKPDSGFVEITEEGGFSTGGPIPPPPRFVSSGGGGGSPPPQQVFVDSSTPEPEIPPEALPMSTASPEVLATQQRAFAVRNLVEEAKQRGVDVSTPARRKGFLNQLIKEEEGTFGPAQPESSGEAFLEERQVSSLLRDGQVIPIIQIFYVDPVKGIDRIASASEKKFFKAQTSVLQASEGSAPSRIVVAAKRVKEKFTSSERRFAENIGTAGVARKVRSSFTEQGDPASQFISGAVEDAVVFPLEKPITATAIYGISRGGGIIFQGLKGVAGPAMKLLPKLITPSKRAQKVFTGGLASTSKPLVTATSLGIGGLVVANIGQRIIQAPTAEAKGGVLGKALIEFGIASKGFKSGQAFATPYKIKTPLRPIQQPVFEEKAFTVIKDGKPFRIARFKIYGERSPPFKIEQTSALRESLYLDPIPLGAKPAKPFLIKTTNPVINNNPFIVASKVGPGGKTKLYEIRGGFDNINLKKDFSGLTPIQKRLNVKLIEANMKQEINLLVQKKQPLLKFLEADDYAFNLARQGKLLIAPKAKLPSDTYGVFLESRLGTPIIGIDRGIKTESLFKETLTHELVHLKTPNFVFSAGRFLPYKLKPAEVIAFSLERFNLKFPVRRDIIKPFEFKTDYTQLPKVPEVKQLKFLTGNLQSRKLDAPLGKSIERFEVAGSLKKVFETETLTLTESTLTFKDVTFPGARASGKTPKLRGTILEYKQPIILSGGKSNSLTVTPSSKTSLTSTFITQLQTPKQLIKALPKNLLPKTKTPTTTITPSIQSTQETFGGVVLAKKQSTVTTKDLPSQTIQVQTQPALVKQNSFVGLASLQNLKSEVAQKQIQQTSLVTALKVQQIPQLKQTLKPQTKLKQKQSVKLKTLQKIKLKVPVSPQIGIPFGPTTKRSTGKPLFTFSKTKEKPVKFSSGTFGVSVRRQGKFKPIGKGLKLSQAFSLGVSKTSRTLAATFKVTPEKGSSISYKTPAGFRRKQTKQGPVFIELPKYRLSKGQEIKEIQLYRRSKK